MRFRTTVFLALLALTCGIVIATVAAVATTIDRAERRETSEELAQSLRAFEKLVEYRQSLLRAQSRVVEGEPRLRAVMAARDVTPETVVGVAQQMRLVAGAELFVLIDEAGALRADVGRPWAAGKDLRSDTLVTGALEADEYQEVRVEAGRAYDMHSRRVEIAGVTFGVLILGYEVDDRFAESVHQQTLTPLVVLLDDVAIAASSLTPEFRVAREQLSGPLAGVPLSNAGPTAVTLGGVRYHAMAAPFPGYSGERSLRYVMLQSMEHAEAERRGAVRVVYVIGAVAIAAVFVLAFWLSRRLVRPLDGLVEFTREIAAGRTDERSTATGPTEVRQLGEAMNVMVRELAESRHEMVAKHRLEQEIEIAARMQSAILPRNLEVSGASIAAWMCPATEVGGDYYDVLAVDDGCWIGFGDVAGHGLPAGIVMVMVQSAIAGMVRHDPTTEPKQLVTALNRVIFTNVRRRLEQDEYVTLSVLRYERSGRVRYAGAHEEIIVCRAANGKCERLATVGTYIGAVPDIERATEQSTCELAAGDLLVLYSDGVIDAANAAGERFGTDRLMKEICRLRDKPVEEICADMLVALGKWAPEPEDDATLLVLRHNGAAR